MKKSLLLLTAVLLCGSTLSAGVFTPERKAARKAVEQGRHARKEAAQSKWLPCTETHSYWDEWDEAWGYTSVTTYTYTDEGRVSTKTESGDRKVYEYDSEGRLVAVYQQWDNDGVFVNYAKETYAYDTVVKNLEVARASYYIDYMEGDEWVVGYEWRRQITRNDEGNVTKCETMENYDGEWEVGYVMEIEYGTDGKAKTITEYQNGEFEERVFDIVWDRTDGQFYDFNNDEACLGNNRPLSAKIEVSAPVVLDLRVEYNDENSYYAQIFMGDREIMSRRYSPLADANGYQETESAIDFDFDEDTGEYYEDGEYSTYTRRIYDDYDLLLEYVTNEYTDGVLDYSEKEVGTVTYDATYGYPLDYTVQSSYDGGELTNLEYTAFSDYIEISGLRTVAADNSEAPVEYFNLQGVRVIGDCLTPGLYIRRQGSVATKVMVR